MALFSILWGRHAFVIVLMHLSLKVEPGGTSHVIWDNGGQNTYRTGAESGYDLRVFDNAPIGKCLNSENRNVKEMHS